MTGSRWEQVARTQPYWGVLSHERFLTARLDDAARTEFWASGERHVAAVFDGLRTRGLLGSRPTVAVDFGCGVGRLLRPLAGRADRVVGVDAAPTMLALARDNLAARGIDNCVLVGSLGELRATAPTYDLVHSTLVFQHIRPSVGYGLFEELVAGLASGGCGVVQFQLATRSAPARLLHAVRSRSRLVGRGAARLRRAPAAAGLIEVHGYDLTRLARILHRTGIGEVATTIAGPDGRDAVLHFRRS